MNALSGQSVPVSRDDKPFLNALGGKASARPPFWLMRQAGRYLPEYREVRAKAGSFLDLCYNPDLAAEVTLQPLRRYGMDAAILFSDILVVPHALGRDVRFEEGEGPRLNPVQPGEDVLMVHSHFERVVAPVMETVKTIRSGMQREGFGSTALIGFAGSPWTVACYMVEGRGSRDFHATRLRALQDPAGFGRLIDVVTDATVQYLEAQIRAGAEAVQLFDSWAGVLDETQFRRWVIGPTRKIAAALKQSYPRIPVIGFPRGAGPNIQTYARETGVTAVSIDQTVPVKWAASTLQSMLPVQGNLDPVCLLSGGDALTMATEHICAHLSNGPFLFNLGHGVIKDTPPEHVAQLARLLRG